MPSPFLEAVDLSKTYRGGFRRRDVEALKGLTLSVYGGEIFGLLGPNGAGKTTFIKLILGLARPTSGTATLMGNSIRNWQARRVVGYLPENHRFPEFLTAHQMLSLYGQLADLDARDTRKQIDEVLELVGMRQWSDVPIRKYSKGMMQRTGLAQSLLGNPSIVFLDEPTDGVDPIGRRDIRSVLLHLKEIGKTVFINSHLLSELEMVCSRVAIINKGRMVREGSLDALLSPAGTYQIRATPISQKAAAEMPELRLVDSQVPNVTDTFNLEAIDTRTYELEKVTRARLNELLDVLRGSGAEIESVTRIRDSLEELFVRSVEESDASQVANQSGGTAT